VVDTFEAWAFRVRREERFDLVVMNPPFSVPENKTIWIDHVRIAFDLLKPGGALMAIVPNGFTFRQDTRHEALRGMVENFGGWRSLPEGSFAETGAPGIRTVLLWLERPGAAQEQPAPFVPAKPAAPAAAIQAAAAPVAVAVAVEPKPKAAPVAEVIEVVPAGDGGLFPSTKREQLSLF
jgi:hypothetical protein